MAKGLQNFSSAEASKRTKVRTPRGEGTKLPYGFGIEELKKGLNALAYADGNSKGFRQALDLKPPDEIYGSTIEPKSNSQRVDSCL